MLQLINKFLDALVFLIGVYFGRKSKELENLSKEIELKQDVVKTKPTSAQINKSIDKYFR